MPSLLSIIETFGACNVNRGAFLEDSIAAAATADEKEMTPEGGSAGVSLGRVQYLGHGAKHPAYLKQ